MTLWHTLRRLALGMALGSVLLSAQPASAQSEAERDLLYATLCIGILWPNGAETQVAGNVSPMSLDLRLRGDALMAAAARAPQALSARLIGEAADGADWRRWAAQQEPGLVAHVEAECLLFLDSYLPPLH